MIFHIYRCAFDSRIHIHRGPCIDTYHCGNEHTPLRDVLNKSDFCDKRLKYKDFYRKKNLKSEYP